MALRLIEGFDDKLFAQRGWSGLQSAGGRFGGLLLFDMLAL